MRTLVQKLRTVEQFLARGRVHGTLTAAGTAVGRVPSFITEVLKKVSFIFCPGKGLEDHKCGADERRRRRLDGAEP